MRTKNLVILASVVGASLALGGMGALVAPSQPHAERPSADARAPEIIAIFGRADWCSRCLDMSPRVDETRKALADQPVLFLTADYSSDAAATQAEYLLGTLDAQQAWADHGKQTAVVVLLDPRSRAVLGTLTDDMSVQQMADAIRQAARL